MNDRERTLRTTLFSVSIAALGFFINFIVGAVLARLLSVSDFGNFSIIKSVVSIIAPAIIVGGSDSSVKFLPIYLTESKWSKVKGYLKFYIQLAIVLVFIFTIISLLLAFLSTGEILHGKAMRWHPVLYSLWIAPIIAIIYLLSDTLRSLKYPIHSTLPFLIFLPILFISLCLLSAAHISHFNIATAIALFAASALMIVSYLTVALYRAVPSPIIQSKASYDIKNWLALSWQIMLYGLFLRLLVESDLVMLEIISPNEKDVGMFAAIICIANIIWNIYTAIIIVYSPKISPAAKNKDHKALKKVYKNSSLINILITTPVAILIFIYAKDILQIFGPDYNENANTLRVVLCSFYLSSLFCMSQPIIQLGGHQNKLIIPMLVIFLLSLALNAVLIPLFGLMGAAISLATTRPAIVLYGNYLLYRYVFSETS